MSKNGRVYTSSNKNKDESIYIHAKSPSKWKIIIRACIQWTHTRDAQHKFGLSRPVSALWHAPFKQDIVTHMSSC